ncbi:hypothetical protein F1542_11705 [Komagataeibacter sp. FXV3]|nr:hypothetical protein [Komagataeibacter sp. FXV3]
MIRQYMPKFFVIILLSIVNLFAITLCFHPHVSENYRNFYILHNITLGEYEANEIRGAYTSHQNRWKY